MSAINLIVGMGSGLVIHKSYISRLGPLRSSLTHAIGGSSGGGEAYPDYVLIK